MCPSAIVGNNQAREVKLKLLLKKNFDLTDERIGRELKRVEDDAYELAGYSSASIPIPSLPMTSMFQSDDAVIRGEAMPPFVRKRMWRQSSLDQLMEEPDVENNN